MIQTESDNPVIRALISEGENIRGLDIARGLETMCWDSDSWREVIGVFTETTPALLEVLSRACPGNLPEYAVTVHGLKGVCFSLGADRAGEQARELELRARAGDGCFVADNHGAFSTVIETLVGDLARLLAKLPARKPVMRAPEPALLARIREAAEVYDVRSLERDIALLGKCSYTDEPDIVSWLRMQSLKSNFSAIAARLAKAVK